MNGILEATAKTNARRRKVERIKSRTEERPVFERYEVLRNVGIYGTYSTFVVSFATGVSFFYYLFVVSMYWQVAMGLSLFTAVVIELLRTYTFDAFFSIAYEEKRFSPPLQITALFGFIFLAVSFATSLYGAKWGYEAFDRDAQKEKASHKTDLASLRQSYDAKIEAETKAYKTDATIAENKRRVDNEKKALADFKTSITWAGAINISDPQVAGNITAFNNRISKLEEENIRYAKSRQAQYEQAIKRIEADRNNALAMETSDHNEKYSEAKTKTEFNTWVWIAIAIAVEIFALAFAWLPKWYDDYCAKYVVAFTPTPTPIEQAYQDAYRALGQILPVLMPNNTQLLPNSEAMNTQSLAQVLAQALNNNPQPDSQALNQGLPTKNQRKIGFDTPKGGKDYEALYQKIKAGEPINRQALGGYGFGVSLRELDAMSNAVNGTKHKVPDDIQKRINTFVANKQVAESKPELTTTIQTEPVTRADFKELKTKVQAKLF